MATMAKTMAAVLPHLLLLTFAPMVSLACPHGCQCYSDVPSVHCYYLGITAVPSGFPPNTTLLAIRHCNITALRRGDFSGMPLLATLYLDWNNISTIEPGTFDGLFHLQSLSFGGNRVAKLAPDLFKDNKLTDFDGSDNRIEAIPSGVFTNHSSLTSLILNGNRISMLGDAAFAGLPQLVEIQINDNLISRLPAHALKGASKLWSLSMARNAISEIELGALSDSTSMQILDLSGNLLMTLEGTLKGLSNLNSLWVSGNRISEITNSTLTSLTSLRDCWLDNNRIRKIESGAFKGMGNLNNFYLGNNDLEEMPLNELVGVLKLDLANNRLQSPPLNMTAAPNLAILMLSGNPMKILAPSQFASLKSIYELDLDNVTAVREHTMDPRALCDVPTLWSVSMKNNNITSFPANLLTCSKSISYLSLAGNRMVKFERDDFYLMEIAHLDLADNRITNISTLSEALGSVGFLYSLTLTGNPMVFLPEKLCPVGTLALDNMKLRAVDKDAFEWMGKLQSINMAKNRLRFLPGKLFANISVEKVNLEGNPWYCDCQMYEFALWMKTNNMSEKFDVVCDGPEALNGTCLSDIPLKNLTCDCVHYQAPTINTTGSDTPVVAGHDARLVCNVTGCPEAAVIWTTPLGDAFSEDSDDPRFSVLSDGGLEIQETKITDAGMYICTAINYLGSSQTSVGLKVKESIFSN
ncbi:insulin-like growth factor-binding protein complex acid labile subunit [Branchiostoma floridae]|uniref:Insulin-like growth factor-binding protein complex acid labile subunit n=1 Tax=Branchiostoma floridae TaxID=7739 RepID=A0A9J7HSC9_BRAFL|nr:insulin-like growth factor-binding protein complex acid labile subunit [Branchiostoma floridae]